VYFGGGVPARVVEEEEKAARNGANAEGVVKEYMDEERAEEVVLRRRVKDWGGRESWGMGGRGRRANGRE
jgi:hypothetical protein